MAISVGHFRATSPSSVWNVCAGKPSTRPPPSTPQAHENVRQSQAHVLGIVARAKRLPFREFRAVENLTDVARFAQLREVLQIHELSGRGGKKRSVGARSNLRNFLEQFDVFGVPAELIIPDQGPKRLTTEYSEFLFIDFLEQSALIELRSALQIAQNFLLAHIENANLQL